MEDILFKFRTAQQAIIDYRQGQLGVAAVPGAGKTFTLSHLAAALVQRLSRRYVVEEQEVLVVTFSNSAVNNFKNRIASILQHERGLLPYTGYRVRTLHGLAHDIVRERPALVGLPEDFQIIDDRQAMAIRAEAVQANLAEWEIPLSRFIDPDISEGQDKRVRYKDLPDMMTGIATHFISRAKAARQTPHQLELALRRLDETFDLARFCTRVYGDYQRSLGYRGAVDFDDLIRLALEALHTDEQLLQRLRNRWPYVLEDEAQDSSHLQELMLRLLTGEQNWVRVGDPNQAINTTFTTADPIFLRNFLDDPGVKSQPLQESGRSSRKIIALANELVRWTVEQHPITELRRLAFRSQQILPTKPGDAQPNPPDAESNLHIHDPQQQISPEKEIELVVKSLRQWLPDNPERTVAVLVPENSRGFKVAEALQSLDIEYEELLRSTTRTRHAATMLLTVLRYLGDPQQPHQLAAVYREVWIPARYEQRIQPDEADDPPRLVAKAISRHREVETLVWPVDESLWPELFDQMNIADLPEDWLDDLVTFIRQVRKWLDALELPIDQLVLTIGSDVFQHIGERDRDEAAADIALTYKIASLLKGVASNNPSWRLAEFVEELKVISDNQRRFIGFDDAETGYEPPAGKVTISTMHAAKGLEWDRVYLMSVNNYSFPSAMPQDEYIGERWFVREDLNLETESLAQLEAIVDNQTEQYKIGAASQQARLDYAAERLRLLYVGITRAKRDLVITWNTGRYWDKGNVKQPALSLYHLHDWLNQQDF